MNTVDESQTLLNELEETEGVLTRVLERLTNLRILLSPIEQTLRAEDFTSRGSFIPGAINGIVCILSAQIKGDPFAEAINIIRGQGREFPSIIMGADRTETKSTCDAILKIIEQHIRNGSIHYVINLRWTTLPNTVDNSKSIVIGKRYYKSKKTTLSKLFDKLKALDFNVLEDKGQFGGGVLTFKITQLVQNIGDLTVLEITLATRIAKNPELVAEILEATTVL